MTLQEQITNAGGVIEYFYDNENWINFLIVIEEYELFKTILEMVEIEVINKNYAGMGGISYSGNLYKGSIQKS